MWKNLKDMVSLWATVGGFIGVLVVFPYINYKINEKEAAAIERENDRADEYEIKLDTFMTKSLRLIDLKMSTLVVKLDTSETTAVNKILYKWEKNFVEKTLPREIDYVASQYLLMEIPVTIFDEYGNQRDGGIEYYVRVKGKFEKIEIEN